MADGMPTEVRSMALAQTGAQIVCQIFAAACVRQVCAEVASCHAFSAFKSKRGENAYDFWGRKNS